MSTEELEEETGLDETELYGDDEPPAPDTGIDDDPEDNTDYEDEQDEDEAPADGKLFPEPEVPVEIREMAEKMKRHELLRMQHANIENQARQDLCAMMHSAGINCFDIDVDGVGYEVERVIGKEKVKSKKITEEE